MSGLISLVGFSLELSGMLNLEELYSMIMFPLIFSLTPIFIMIYSFLAIAIMDKRIENNERYILKIAEKKGITGTMDYPT